MPIYSVKFTKETFHEASEIDRIALKINQTLKQETAVLLNIKLRLTINN
jgi:hypothetical protein